MSIIRILKANKQLFTGLLVGGLIMLTTGLYSNARNISHTENVAEAKVTKDEATSKNTAKEVYSAPISEDINTPTSTSVSANSTKHSAIYVPTSIPAPKVYLASVCAKTNIIPYKTNYKNRSSLAPGEIYVSQYEDGYTMVCSPDSNGIKSSDYSINVYDKNIYVGDGGASTAQPIHDNTVDGATYEGAYAWAPKDCAPDLSNGGGNTANQICILALLS